MISALFLVIYLIPYSSQLAPSNQYQQQVSYDKTYDKNVQGYTYVDYNEFDEFEQEKFHVPKIRYDDDTEYKVIDRVIKKEYKYAVKLSMFNIKHFLFLSLIFTVICLMLINYPKSKKSKEKV